MAAAVERADGGPVRSSALAGGAFRQAAAAERGVDVLVEGELEGSRRVRFKADSTDCVTDRRKVPQE